MLILKKLLGVQFPIWGNDHENLLQGGTGHDTIYGLDDDDTLTGGEGNDWLYGGDDDDKILGEQGRDMLFGGWGDDSIAAGDEADTVEGGLGHDSIWGGSGDDLVWGADYSDLIVGGSGHDQLNGGFGGDTIDGGKGNDTLIGGGGYGPDLLIGGDDADRFVRWDVPGSERIADFDPSEGDVIDIGQFSFAGLSALKAATDNQGDGIVIELAVDTLLIIDGVQKSNMQADWFEF